MHLQLHLNAYAHCRNWLQLYRKINQKKHYLAKIDLRKSKYPLTKKQPNKNNLIPP